MESTVVVDAQEAEVVRDLLVAESSLLIDVAVAGAIVLPRVAEGASYIGDDTVAPVAGLVLPGGGVSPLVGDVAIKVIALVH